MVKLDLVGSNDQESFFKVSHQLPDLSSIHHEVIDIHLMVPADLLLETLLHAPLEGCPCALEAKRHGSVAESTEWGDERCG